MTGTEEHAGKLRGAFDVDRALEEVREWNRDPLYPASDYIVGKLFADYRTVDAETAATGLRLLDLLWNTQLRFDPGAAEGLCRAYVLNLRRLDESFRLLDRMRLETEPEKVREIAEPLLGVFLEVGENGHYSFATKVLHWHARRHLPIMDSQARKAVRDLMQQCELAPVASAVTRDRCAGDYGRWIEFYANLIRSLSAEDRQALIAADHGSLPDGYRIRNSLLRIVDKVLFLRGKRKQADG
ncbi:MAG: hypothetical protein MUQ65_16305 [Armatimonadetes bacterium]|nr:hypothetical protein [Armatimonadota bacterium]